MASMNALRDVPAPTFGTPSGATYSSPAVPSLGQIDEDTSETASVNQSPPSPVSLRFPPLPPAVPALGTNISSKDDPKSKKKAAQSKNVGMQLKIKRVKEHYNYKVSDYVLTDYGGFWTRFIWWFKTLPHRKNPKRDPFSQYAFTLDYKDSSRSQKSTVTLDIRSPYLRKAGREVIGKISGVSWSAKPCKIIPNTLLLYLNELNAYVADLQKKQLQGKEKSGTKFKPKKDDPDALMISHVSFLTSYLSFSYAHDLETLSSLLTSQEINFKLVWTLFQPRRIVFFTCPITQQPRAARVVTTYFEESAWGDPATSGIWNVTVEYVEWNATGSGKGFGLCEMNVPILGFEGPLKINTLNCYPIEYHVGSEELKKTLIKRGRKWSDHAGVYHRYYEGTAYHQKGNQHIKLTIDSRIMIDMKMFGKIAANYDLPVNTRNLDGDSYTDINSPSDVIDPAPDGSQKVQSLKKKRTEPTDDDLLIATPIVYGFSLADKVWMEFNIVDVRTFEWNDEAFENLVLPRNQKDLVKSLVEAHGMFGAGANAASHLKNKTNTESQSSADSSAPSSSSSDSNTVAKKEKKGVPKIQRAEFDDFVEGKGRGLIINLFGNPGVGKSLTAEATSEHVRKPLYIVGAGDLGTGAASLDGNLTTIFNICAEWGAVVLIDEADVFLEERSFHELERNAMVAVFLRQLEYFRGILFLTTNRVRTFDDAFQSRIHVSLRYLDLTSEAKRTIWVAFLAKALRAYSLLPETLEKSHAQLVQESSGLSKEQLRELGEKRVNGRQIKNVVRTAAVLARSKDEEVGFKHLNLVLEMMEDFENIGGMYN